MDIDKFKKNLKKIINFNDWSYDENVKLTRIEKDILLEYIRKLYKSVLIEKYEMQSSDTVKVKKNDKKSDLNHYAKEKQAKFQKATDDRKPVSAKELIKSDKIEVEKPTDEINEENPSKREEQSKDLQKVEDGKTIKVEISDEFLQIFKERNSKELSEKLSMLPVNDLKKAFGLNEKIFTVNELFDGDSGHFDKVIHDLNELSSFSEAKDYIISNLIEKFKWDTDLKLKKAEQFVNTIRKRYSH